MLPKDGVYKETYSAYEPIPFRPSGYKIELGGLTLIARNMTLRKGALRVDSTNWVDPATTSLADNAPLSFYASARVYDLFEKGFSATDYSLGLNISPGSRDDSVAVNLSDLSFDTVDQLIEAGLGASGFIQEYVRYRRYR